MNSFAPSLKELAPAVPPTAVQAGNLLEIVPSKDLQMQHKETHEVSSKKFIVTQEMIQAKLEKKAEMKKKRKSEREKKRLEKKMRKEKLKLEIKRLISMGVTVETFSSDEEGPFDDIIKKGIFGTKDRGILRPSGAK